jgi:pimeloyl-ACP methyl ester carboxylesterase
VLRLVKNQNIIMTSSIQFQGKNISYESVGQGDAIVLLHGFIESKKIWNEFAGKLSAEFHVLSVDLPGHGESEVIAEIHTMRLMAEVVKSVMEQERIGSAVIVGHSMGGYVALEFGQLFPEKVNGLILFHSQAAADSDEAKENRRRTINIVKQNRAGFIKQFIPDLFDQRHVDSYSGAIELLLGEASKLSQESIIAAISGMKDRRSGLIYLMTTNKPILFIIGKQDSRIPYNTVLAQAVIPAHSETLMLDHVGHMGYIEAPAVTLQAIRYFSLRCFSL